MRKWIGAAGCLVVLACSGAEFSARREPGEVTDSGAAGDVGDGGESASTSSGGTKTTGQLKAGAGGGAQDLGGAGGEEPITSGDGGSVPAMGGKGAGGTGGRSGSAGATSAGATAGVAGRGGMDGDGLGGHGGAIAGAGAGGSAGTGVIEPDPCPTGCTVQEYCSADERKCVPIAPSDRCSSDATGGYTWVIQLRNSLGNAYERRYCEGDDPWTRLCTWKPEGDWGYYLCDPGQCLGAEPCTGKFDPTCALAPPECR